MGFPIQSSTILLKSQKNNFEARFESLVLLTSYRLIFRFAMPILLQDSFENSKQKPFFFGEIYLLLFLVPYLLSFFVTKLMSCKAT